MDTSPPPAWSLHGDLTKFSFDAAQTPAAIDLITLLLKAVARDACGASRNTQRLYKSIARARDLGNSIKTQIDIVEGVDDTTSLEQYTAAFDQYTGQIGPLEQ